MTTFDPAAMRARFKALGENRERILALSAPIREKRDALRAKQDALRDEMKPLELQMRQIEAPLYDLDQERAMLARALGGRTG